MRQIIQPSAPNLIYYLNFKLRNIELFLSNNYEIYLVPSSVGPETPHRAAEEIIKIQNKNFGIIKLFVQYEITNHFIRFVEKLITLKEQI